MMGSVSGGRWNNIALPILISILGLLLLFLRARAYNLISLGDETAISMGVKPSNLKRFTAVTVAVVTGVIVSNCGLIGLVGFVIPHVVRLVSGPDHRRLIPISFFTGAIFLVWMDMFARYIMAPSELPIGNLLNNVDFPTLGLPTIHTTGFLISHLINIEEIS